MRCAQNLASCSAAVYRSGRANLLATSCLETAALHSRFLQRRQHLGPECQRRLPAVLPLKWWFGGCVRVCNTPAVYNGTPALDVTLSQEIVRITPVSKGTEEDKRQTLQSPPFHTEKQSWLVAWAALFCNCQCNSHCYKYVLEAG